MKHARTRISRSFFATLAVAVFLVVLVACTLTACNLFASSQKVTSAHLVFSGNVDYSASEELYEVPVGEDLIFDVQLNLGASPDAEIMWYSAQGNSVEYIGGGKGIRQFVHSFDEVDGKVYRIYAIAGGVRSEEISFRAVYARLSRADITSPSHHIVDGVIRQPVNSATDVTLVGRFNDNMHPDAEVLTTWYVLNGDVYEQIASSAVDGTLVYSHEGGVGEVHIRMMATCNGVTLFDDVVLSYVEEYAAVRTVDVELRSSGTFGSDGQYISFNDNGSTTDVTVAATVQPDDTDLNSSVTWEVRNANGTYNPPTNGWELTFTPAYGENFVTATIDGVESRHIVVFRISQSDYAAHESVIDDVFLWRGGIHNFYITDEEDLEAVVNYVVSMHKTGSASRKEWYLARSEWKVSNVFAEDTSAEFKELFRDVIGSVDESGSFSLSYGTDGVEVTAESVFGIPTEAYPTQYDVVQQKSLTTYNKDASSSATLFDGVQSSLAVATDSNMLYRLVEWGYRPEFVDTPQSQAAKAIYLRARDVAKSIATDDMTDVEKVRAVYEWIITNVDYDYGAAAQDLNAPETLKYNAFYLEGVFLDGRAVCDGKAKAFSLLCGLLGINSVRITGTAESGGTSGGHAWNKVLVDTQGNGYKRWYVVDTTWGDVRMDTGSISTVYELMSYDYLLVSDAVIADTHTARSSFDPPATDVYNVYADTFVDEGDTSLYITSDADLQALVAYLDDNLEMWVSIKVSSSYASSETALRSKLVRICMLKQFSLQASLESNDYWLRRY